MKDKTNTNFLKQYRPSTKARVELKNGHILDVINGVYLDAGASVVLHGGKIESLPWNNGELQVPVDFSIDLKGKTVLPGLFNTHCHLFTVDATMIPGLSDIWRSKRYSQRQLEKNLADCLAHGITNVRDAWQPDLRENRILSDRISKGELSGPRIQQAVVVGPAGSYMQEKLPLMTRLVGGVAQVEPSDDNAGSVSFPLDATEAQVRTAVDIAIDERGADVIKIGDEPFSFLARKAVPVMTLGQLSTLADQARRRGLQSTMHLSSIESFQRGLKAGVSSLAHLPMDGILTQSDINAIKASGCIIDPTLSAFYPIFSWKLAKNGFKDHPELTRFTEFRDNTYTFADIAEEYYLQELRTSVMNGYKRCASGKTKLMGFLDTSEFLAWSERTDNIFQNFRLLYENDVPMTTANDNKSPCTPAMMDLELRMFGHFLMPEPFSGAEAIKIATINSAYSLGLEKAFGSIEPGKTADLVILEGDPLEDYTLIGSRVEALFLDGKLVINNCDLEVQPNGKA